MTSEALLQHAITLTCLQWFVHHLLCFGAVYWCPVPPALSAARAACMDDKHLSRLSWQREAAIIKHGRQVTHKCRRLTYVYVQLAPRAKGEA